MGTSARSPGRALGATRPSGFRGLIRVTFHVATSSLANEVIYGSANNRKVRAINTLLIDDQIRHLWTPTSSLATTSMREDCHRDAHVGAKPGAASRRGTALPDVAALIRLRFTLRRHLWRTRSSMAAPATEKYERSTSCS